ncbi:hypothetical protein [Streptomyces sp. NPDC002088]|uniref:hypothetical protein n=1 Tax=Streptomyces sp. NPDC002088 TaxID=3154665 RepID=UPI00332930DA
MSEQERAAKAAEGEAYLGELRQEVAEERGVGAVKDLQAGVKFMATLVCSRELASTVIHHSRSHFMGDHFKTDTDQLGQFLKTLESCIRDLDEARTALAHVRADQIGTKRLDEACDGFQERWKYGSEQTKKMVETVSEGVKSNKKAYEEVEDALEKAFKDMAAQATSGHGGAK